MNDTTKTAPWDDEPGTQAAPTPPAPSSGSIRLSPDQEFAVQALARFIEDPNPPSWFFTFSGPAGTGKTFCMREVVSLASRSHVSFAYTTPTNKAAKVLRAITGEAGTIFKLLGLRLDKSGEVKRIATDKKPDLSHIDVIFVDEASMINKQLFGILEGYCQNTPLKVVFMGDRCQLPPVGEEESRVWDSDMGVTLTKVMRHDNQILNLATAVRQEGGKLAPTLNFKGDHDAAGGVWKLSKPDFKKTIYDAACRGEFADGTAAKVVAWRNVKVEEYNNLIRAGIFGASAEPGYYLPGDRIVAAGPCEQGDMMLMHTDDEAIVMEAANCKHPMEPKYKAIELKCVGEEGQAMRLLVIHPDSILDFKRDSEKLAEDARFNGKLWKNFWAHQELFHQIKYGYALTAHRAQGSTYKSVWVDYIDILANRNRKEAFMCLYTAVSRPTTNLYMG